MNTDSLHSSSNNANVALKQELENAQAQNESLTRNVTELKSELEGMEKERDFYFDKLREIEVMLQELEGSGKGNEISASIFKILYATADGFEVATGEEMEQGDGQVQGQGQGGEEYESF